MRAIILLLWTFGLTALAAAQMPDSARMISDAVHLEEVNISGNMPLNNDDVVDFYRNNYFTTLDNLYARLNGMAMIKRGAYGQEPQLNGFSGGQLNVTIDGMKMFGACSDKMDPVTSYIEPTNLRKITITPGTLGAANGCNIGGSLDMSLQEPASRSNVPFYSSLGIGYESVSNSRNVLFSTGYIKPKWAFGLDGVYRKNENYVDGANELVPFSQFQKANLHAVIKYQPDSLQTYKVDCLYDDARNVGYPALPMDVSFASASLVALEYRRDGQRQLKAKIYLNTVNHVMDDSNRDSLYLPAHAPPNKPDSVYMRMDMPGSSSTMGSYVQLTIPCGRKHLLKLKADHYTNWSVAEMTMHMRYAGLTPESPMYMQTWPAMMRYVTGVFAQNTTILSEKLILILDGRMDYNTDVLQAHLAQQQFSVFNYLLSKQQNKLVKNITISSKYHLLKGLCAIATTGYAERMPTIRERLGYYLYNAYDGYEYIGQPYLNTEKTAFFRMAFTVSKPKLKVNFSQSFSLVNDYIIGLTDTLIPTMTVYAKGIRTYQNVAQAKLHSTDLQILHTPNKHLSVFLNSKLTLGSLGSLTPLPLLAPLTNSLGAQYQKGNARLQAVCENALDQNRINYDYGELPTPGFTVFNMKSGYTIKLNNGTVDVSFGISNIFNKVYYTHLDWGRIYRPGRSYELFLKYDF